MGSVVKVKTLVQNSYKGKRVLVTGHTGFKGSWLTMFLARLGAKVSGVALAPESPADHFLSAGCEKDLVQHTIGDITTSGLVAKLMKELQPEIVFHLAAQPLVRRSYEDPIETYNTNVMGSLQVLEAIRHTPSVQALVYVTSDKCYLNKEWVWGYRETDELGGHDPYSASKALAELLLTSHWKSYLQSRPNFGAASARAGNVIGGGDFAKDRIVPDCVRSAATQTPIVLRNPQSTRPWQHVLDPVYGYLLLGAHLLESPKEFSGAWNFGPNADSIRTVGDLAEKFLSLWPGSTLKNAGDSTQPHEAGVLHLNCDKAHHGLKWFPNWDFESTMLHTVEWYRGWNQKIALRELSQKQLESFLEHLK